MLNVHPSLVGLDIDPVLSICWMPIHLWWDVSDIEPVPSICWTPIDLCWVCVRHRTNAFNMLDAHPSLVGLRYRFRQILKVALLLTFKTVYAWLQSAYMSDGVNDQTYKVAFDGETSYVAWE